MTDDAPVVAPVTLRDAPETAVATRARLRTQRARTRTSAPCTRSSDVTLAIPRPRGDGDHRPVGVRQVDAPALPQPHARDHSRRARRRDASCSMARTSTRTASNPIARPPAHRHGLPAADAVSHDVDPRQRRRRASRVSARTRPTRRETDEIVERALRRAALWDEVKDRLERRARPRSPAASSSGCASRARWRPSREVLLLDEPTASLDPLSTQKVEELVYELRAGHDRRDRHAQHAAGGARLGPHGVHAHAASWSKSAPTRTLFTTPPIRGPRRTSPEGSDERASAPRRAAPSRAAQPPSRRNPAIRHRPRDEFSFWYGEKQALLRHRRSTMPPRVDHGAHRAVGMRQVDVPALDQPAERADPGRAHTGEILLDGEDIYAPGHGRRRAAAARRDGVPALEPVPEVDLRQRRLRAAHQRQSPSRASSTRSSKRRCGAPRYGTR